MLATSIGVVASLGGASGASQGAMHRWCRSGGLSQQPLLGVSQKYPGPMSAQSWLVVHWRTPQLDGTCPHLWAPSGVRMHMHVRAALQY